MMSTSRLTLSALCAALLVTLSLTAATPAQARGGAWMVHQTTKFMMKNGSRYAMNTRAEALARQKQEQLAAADEDGERAEDPGWFIELISICDHLKDTGITCE